MTHDYRTGDALSADQVRALPVSHCHFVGKGFTEKYRLLVTRINRGDDGEAAKEALERIATGIEAGRVTAVVEGLRENEISLHLEGPDDYMSGILTLAADEAPG